MPPDLTKHIARAKSAIEKRSYDLAIEVLHECVDVDPIQLDVHKLHLEAARRKAKEKPKGMFDGIKGMGNTLSLTKDPHKQFIAVFKKLSANPEPKVLVEVADSAAKLIPTLKPMVEVSLYYYEEFRATGMFNDKALWSVANLYHDRFTATKEPAWLDKALKAMRDLEKAMPNHPEASRMTKNWEAEKSMDKRESKGNAGDYKSQLNNSDGARRAEIENRQIRTEEDAKLILGYIEDDLKANANDKNLWIKKGDIHRRFTQYTDARAAFEKAQAIDMHDFTITMRLGDMRMEEQRAKVIAAKAAGQDVAQAEKSLLALEIEEYKKRVERQPTDMGHRFNLGRRFYDAGMINEAAGELQKTVLDAKYKRDSHKWLGNCFAKKKLYDLAGRQYEEFLKVVDDPLSDAAKDIRYLFARMLENQNKLEAACEQYEKLVSLDLGFRDAADRLTRLRSGEAGGGSTSGSLAAQP
jgi:tetratricopeptide (TPR) repeat protein